MKPGAEKSGAKESGQAILESVIVMLVILMILLGLLQIYQLAVAKLLTNYSAFRSLRSYIVGFNGYLVQRSVRVGALGASGKMTYPNNQDFGSPQAQFAAEYVMIPYYLNGTRWLEYEYWHGDNQYDPAYYHSSVTPPRTFLRYSYSGGTANINQRVYFDNYPYAILDMADRNRVWFPLGSSTDISGNAAMFNHSADYLRED